MASCHIGDHPVAGQSLSPKIILIELNARETRIEQMQVASESIWDIEIWHGPEVSSIPGGHGLFIIVRDNKVKPLLPDRYEKDVRGTRHFPWGSAHQNGGPAESHQ